jgi:xanthine/CO dehydrogenase XdhC/CoxF family maturation factor
MIHWKETAEIFGRVADLSTRERRAALATVVEVVGSAYRRPGAKLLIEESGGTLGSVSGGCLEADVRAIAAGVLATGTPSLRHYDTGEEDVAWGLGLGCNGQVHIFVQSATQGPLATLAAPVVQLLAGDTPVAIVTVVADGPAVGAMMAIECPESSDGDDAVGAVYGSLGAMDLDSGAAECARRLATTARSAVQEVMGRKVFVEVLQPAPHLMICGADADARPLVSYAAAAGFRVELFDHRDALLAPERFPQATRRIVARPEDAGIVLPPAARSLAVVKTHSLTHDREWVRRLLAAGFPYVGVQGPRARTASILRDVEMRSNRSESGHWDAGRPADRRVFGPVGLDLGADGPEQVAISIVAELLAFIAKRDARHLSQRLDAIHAS